MNLTLIIKGFGKKKNSHLYCHSKLARVSKSEDLGQLSFGFGILNKKDKGIKVSTLLEKKVDTQTGQRS